jgi:predicted Zn-dependent protease
LKEALAEYAIAYKLEPLSVLTLVNSAMAHAKLGEPAKAEAKLTEALKIDPDSSAARYNLGLVKAELGDLAAAEANLKAAFKSDPQLAGAAYNLCIITASDRPAESLDWCKKAVALRPQEPKYAATLAFYQQQGGDSTAAIKTLETLIDRIPAYPDGYLLLAEIYAKQGKKAKVTEVYRQALAVEGLPPKAREFIKTRLEAPMEKP